MRVERKIISIRELSSGYVNDPDLGIRGLNGRLVIRPSYQRSFCYNDEKQRAVLDSVIKGYPIGMFYWVENEHDIEVLDGQQRILSICKFIEGTGVSIEDRWYTNFSVSEKNKILDYEIQVNICSDCSTQDKYEWFARINTPSAQLTKQELRNAMFSGPWVSSARRHFGFVDCKGHQNMEGYFFYSKDNTLSHKHINRQWLLEKVLGWLSDDKIDDYMKDRRNLPNADGLWNDFTSLSKWIKDTFPISNSYTKLVDWGLLYREYKDKTIDVKAIQKEVKDLLGNKEVPGKVGIYRYVLSRNKCYLNLRLFTPEQKRKRYDEVGGNCELCNIHFEFDEVDADHRKSWKDGGDTSDGNCQILCRTCNRSKGSRSS